MQIVVIINAFFNQWNNFGQTLRCFGMTVENLKQTEGKRLTQIKNSFEEYNFKKDKLN